MSITIEQLPENIRIVQFNCGLYGVQQRKWFFFWVSDSVVLGKDSNGNNVREPHTFSSIKYALDYIEIRYPQFFIDDSKYEVKRIITNTPQSFTIDA